MSALRRILRKLMASAANLGAAALLLFACARAAWASPQTQPRQESDQPEVTSHETEPTFKLRTERNLVVVRVVVRDSKGNAVGGFHKEDFRLLDNGKPQIISQFSVEVPSAPAPVAAEPAGKADESKVETERSTAFTGPQRYIALYFDDVHMAFEDIARTRDAAAAYLGSALQPTDRAGIFRSSGQGELDFTDDRAAIHNALFALQPRPVVPRESDPCPDISPYQAYLIIDRQDPDSIQIATMEDLHCRYGDDTRYLAQAQAEAQAAAMHAQSGSETETEAALRRLDEIVRRLSVIPGQRNVVLMSPGFITENDKPRMSDIIDRALRLKVVVNALDSQGLYVVQLLGDASHQGVIPLRADLVGLKSSIRVDEARRNEDVLEEIADATGGVYFHNSNDLNEGFRRVGSLPALYYELGFSPQTLKLDGRFHQLKVALSNPKGLTVQARRGYFAPHQSEDVASQVKEEIQEAVFSQDEVNELPLDVHTQFFRLSESDAKLAVLTHVDLRHVHFRKTQGRNWDNLTLVTALFDRDGKYVTGVEKTLEMRLRDVSLEELAQSGITIKSSFDVKPGTYMVRQVVRDAEGAQLSGLSRTVEIPF